MTTQTIPVSVKEAKLAFANIPVNQVWRGVGLLGPQSLTVSLGDAEVSVSIPSLEIDKHVVVPVKPLKSFLVDIPKHGEVNLSLRSESIHVADGEFPTGDQELGTVIAPIRHLGEPWGEAFDLPAIPKEFPNAASLDATRSNLCGVFVSPDNKQIAASNGHILFVTDLGYCETGIIGGVIPTDVIKIAMRMGRTKCQFYKRNTEDHFAVLWSETVSIITPVVKDFPDYKQVMNPVPENHLAVNGKVLKEIADDWLKVIGRNSRNPGIAFQGNGDSFVITGDSDGQKLRKEIPVKRAGNLKFGVNAYYLRTALSLHENIVVFKLGDNNKDGQVDRPIHICSGSDNSIISIIMPMRVF